MFKWHSIFSPSNKHYRQTSCAETAVRSHVRPQTDRHVRHHRSHLQFGYENSQTVTPPPKKKRTVVPFQIPPPPSAGKFQPHAAQQTDLKEKKNRRSRSAVQLAAQSAAKFHRATISYVTCARPHGTTRLPLDGFLWNLSIFRKYVD